ncbi:unnamed protein product [Laminaria digitata]
MKKDKDNVTPFQASVYKAISGIPAGQVSTYGGVAQALNSCARAVGGALRRNPFAPVVPCHRVVMGDLSIGGFSGSFGDCADTRRKRKMLEEEGVRFVGHKVAGSAFVHVFPPPPAGKGKGKPLKKAAQGGAKRTAIKAKGGEAGSARKRMKR